MLSQFKVFAGETAVMGFIGNLELYSITMDKLYLILGIGSASLPILLNGRRLLVELVEWVKLFRSKTTTDEWKREFGDGTNDGK
jgi:hypothetical protein